MPKPHTVTRTVTDAPAATILALLTVFHEWTRWSPWEDIDPDMQRSDDGPERGVGAGYAREGDKKAGKGMMRITGVSEDRVDVDLHFDKPFPADNTIEFGVVEQAPERTTVTWTMHGELNLFLRLFGIFTSMDSMDSMVGPDFEKGLRQLKAAAEAR